MVDRAPRGFRYALKLSRYATHMKHLKDPDEWLDRFVDRAEQLGAHLGPVLVQLPPHWNPDPQRLGAFLDEAPNDIRWAVECRDERWLTEKVFETLSEANAALVIHDLIDDHPRHLTADFVYLRFHGPDRRNPYHGEYAHQSLAAHARRAAQWIDSGHAVYAFFNNDADGFAPRDARRLQRYLDDALDRG